MSKSINDLAAVWAAVIDEDALDAYVAEVVRERLQAERGDA